MGFGDTSVRVCDSVSRMFQGRLTLNVDSPSPWAGILDSELSTSVHLSGP